MVSQDLPMVGLEPSGSSPGGPASSRADCRSAHGSPRALYHGVVGVRGCRQDCGPESLPAAWPTCAPESCQAELANGKALIF